MVSKVTGFARLYYATRYSLQGLKAAFNSEPAIRQELAAMCVLIPLACYLNVSGVERAIMIASLFIVLITELLNSGLEALCDHISTDMHPLLGKAKDIGSAAVFVALVMVAAVWGLILFS